MGYKSLSTILGNGYLPPHRKPRFGGLFFDAKAHFTGPRRATRCSKCFSFAATKSNFAAPKQSLSCYRKLIGPFASREKQARVKGSAAAQLQPWRVLWTVAARTEGRSPKHGAFFVARRPGALLLFRFLRS